MRYYSSTAGAMTLSANAAAGDTTITVSSTSGLPVSFPYALILDPGGAEEIVDVTAAAGTTLTVTRGVDGTSAQSHSMGDPVRHGFSARDLRESREHEVLTAVHGATGAVVGTTNTQTLDNKTFQSASGVGAPLKVKQQAAQTTAVFQALDSGGTEYASFNPGEGTLKVGTTSNVNASAAATLYGYVARLIASAASVVGLVVKGAAAQTADLQQWQNSAGTVLAKVDAAGAVTASGATLTGGLSGTTGSFSGAVSGTSLTTTGTVTANTVSATGTITTPGSVSGSNIPGTIAATSASKDKKKLHWGTYTGTTTAGAMTITHGCGFTPTVAVGNNTAVSTNQVITIYNITATQADVAWRTATGTTPADGSSMTCAIVWGE